MQERTRQDRSNHYLDSGHMAMISHPEELAAILNALSGRT